MTRQDLIKQTITLVFITTKLLNKYKYLKELCMNDDNIVKKSIFF